MRVDEDNKLLELREKKSFTNERHEEPASAGIYYFKNFYIFKKYSESLTNSTITELPEAYVSLLYNEMVNDGLNIIVTEVEKFICLGTPSDYEQFIFWHRYFVLNKSSIKKISSRAKQVTLIPMAGRGSRFVDYGYRVAKPIIQVDGKPMVTHAIESHPVQDNWIFVVRKEDKEKHRINRIFDNLGLKYDLICVDKTTSGQAATCLLAENKIDDNSELFISSCDYRVIFDYRSWQMICSDISIDGAIWTTKLKGMPIKNPDAFAYCIVDDNTTIIKKIVEKKTISKNPNLDPLIIGTFWFRKASDFKMAAKHLIKHDITVNGEYYIGTSINYLIKNGKKFVIFDIDQWISFGDPFELNVIEYWKEHFYKS